MFRIQVNKKYEKGDRIRLIAHTPNKSSPTLLWGLVMIYKHPYIWVRTNSNIPANSRVTVRD